jgi:hypothetical protein
VEPKPKDAPCSKKEGYHGLDGFGDASFASEPDISLVNNQPGVLALIELASKHKGIVIN